MIQNAQTSQSKSVTPLLSLWLLRFNALKPSFPQLIASRAQIVECVDIVLYVDNHPRLSTWSGVPGVILNKHGETRNGCTPVIDSQHRA